MFATVQYGASGQNVPLCRPGWYGHTGRGDALYGAGGRSTLKGATYGGSGLGTS